MSSVEDLQSMALGVSELLNQGIEFLCKICICLRNVHVYPTTGLSSNFKQIREHIKEAPQRLNIAETKIKEMLRYLDENMERLILMKQNLEQQKQEMFKAINTLQIARQSAEEMLNYSEEALEQAEIFLQTAYYVLKSAQGRRKEAEDLTKVGGGGALFAIPILGWIAGSVMLSQGVPESNRASDDIRAAEREQQKFGSEVKEKFIQVIAYQEKICDIEDEIEHTNEAVVRIKKVIEVVQMHQENTANIQEKVRRAVSLVNVLVGRVDVLEKQTRHFANWRSVVNIMEEVTKAVIDVAVPIKQTTIFELRL